MAIANKNTEQTALLKAVLQQFTTFEATLNGQAQLPLHTLRKQALKRLEQLGFPTIKHEEWKYTNLKNLVNKELLVQDELVQPSEETAKKLLQLTDLQDNLLVFVNGVLDKKLSKISLDSSQIIVENLADACKKYPELVEKYLAKLATDENNALLAMNTAFIKQGVFIYVKAKAVIEQPIFIQYLTDTTTNSVLVQPRHLIVLERSSQLTLVEKYRSIGNGLGLNNAVTEIYVSPNATFDHYKLQNDTATVSHIGMTEVHQQKDSRYHNTTVTLNGDLVRNNLHIAIDGENCESYMNGLYAPTGSTHIDNHTLADHRKPHSYSNELYKGILDGKSTGVFNGKIYVQQAAQKTNAFQSNRNILLSPTASVNTKPQLEIWADDVKCSHGCTTGALDEEPLFYLRSRGIPASEARALLLFAFAEDVLQRIKVPSLRAYVEDVIGRRLNVMSGE